MIFSKEEVRPLEEASLFDGSSLEETFCDGVGFEVRDAVLPPTELHAVSPQSIAKANVTDKNLFISLFLLSAFLLYVYKGALRAQKVLNL